MRHHSMGGVLKIGATLGFLSGCMATIIAIGLVGLIDAKEGTQHLAKMWLPVTIISLGLPTVGVMLVYGVRYGRVALAPVLRQNQGEWAQVERMPEWEQAEEEAALWAAAGEEETYAREMHNSPVIEAIQPDVQRRAVIKCIEEQLTAQYQYGENPSRVLFERNGTPQPIWNTARGILKRAGFVDDTGRQWVLLPWEVVSGLMTRIRTEGDHRIWMPAPTGRALVNAVISDQLQAGNSYLVPPPH